MNLSSSKVLLFFAAPVLAFAKVEEMIKECLNNLHKYSITQRLL